MLFTIELWYLRVTLREFRDDIIDEPLQRLVTLGNIRIWNLNFHVFLLEIDSIPKHLNGQVFVKVCVGTLRVFGSSILWDVRCAIRFRQQVIFLFTSLAIRAISITDCVLSLELLSGRAIFVCLIGIARYLVHPFVDIEIVVHLRCWSSTFD